MLPALYNDVDGVDVLSEWKGSRRECLSFTEAAGLQALLWQQKSRKNHMAHMLWATADGSCCWQQPQDGACKDGGVIRWPRSIYS
jgi:hypothetical protein